MTNHYRGWIASSILVLGLAACGGGGGDGHSARHIDLNGATLPASLENPTSVARAAIATTKIVQPATGAALILGGSAELSVPPGDKKKCQGGGTIQAKESGGIQIAKDCRYDNSRIDGVFGLNCMNPQDGKCGNSNPVFGASSGDGKPFLYQDNKKDGNSDRLFVRGHAKQTATFNGEGAGKIKATLNQQYQLRNLDRKNAQVGLFAKRLRITSTLDAATDDSTVTYDGTFGLGEQGNSINCTVGQLNVTTIAPIQRDNQRDIVGGKLQFKNSMGQAAMVTFSRDGGVTVAIEGDKTVVKPKALRDFCTLY